MKVSRKPSYSLEEMKALVDEGAYMPSGRVVGFIAGRYPDLDVDEVVRTVFSELRDDDFSKSVELSNLPGTMADIYVGGCYDDTEWYVKAFIDGGRLNVLIWSMCWDGCAH